MEIFQMTSDPFLKDINYCEKKNMTNGAILDLFQLGKSKSIENVEIVNVIGRYTGHAQDINIKATLAKYYRLLQQDKSKRGEARDTFRDQLFSVPASTSSEKSCLFTPSTSAAVESTKSSQEALQVKQKIISTLREENKQLKRKLDRRDNKALVRLEEKRKKQKLITDFNRKTRIVTNMEKVVQQKTRAVKRLSNQTSILRKSLVRATAEIENIKFQNGAIVNRNLDLERQDVENIKELEQANKEIKRLQHDLDYFQNLIQDENEEVKVFDEQQNAYTNNLVECCMNLTNYKVSTRNVGLVINEVGKLCGKTFNRLPTRQCVDKFVDRKVSVGQKQIGQILSKSQNTTLYTDETRKHGHTFESFIVSDADNAYLLGLREMENKSGATTLETFKTILDDISSHCKWEENEREFGTGYEILANIKNTMSDRASTEKHFNNLLKDYRSTILPEIVENYNQMSEEEKNLCGSMNNFFCGLHLLVGMADVAEASIREFETNFLDGKEIGSCVKPELKRYHRAESGCLRLLRTSSKSFAMGEDEKNGVFLPWRTYLTEKEEKNHVLRFKHNRFNMVFLIGQAVYYHRDMIVDFLQNVHGQSNDLLKAVLLDSKEDLYLAGAKALGLISKFITAPLWRLIEQPGHILDMNQHFDQLVTFLDKACEDPEITMKFMTGEAEPFHEPVDEENKVVQELLQRNDQIDEICLPLIQGLFAGFSNLLRRMIPEHLQAGTYWEAPTSKREETASALKHNKLPEFVFGQLDHLVSFRPNASILANESFIMYSFNKTSKWLENLEEKERDMVLKESRKEGREIRERFRKRLKEIEGKRVETQRKRQQEMERLERVRIEKAENLTQDVCYFGLWQSPEQVNEGIADLDGNENVIKKALKCQLKFRKSVLKQKCKEKKVFNFSMKLPNGKIKYLSNDELKTNLLLLVRSALQFPGEERKCSDTPLLVGKTVDHTFSENCYRGKVISVVPGFPDWYNIKYDNDSAIYAYNLHDDYSNGNLKIVIDSSE